MATRLKPLFEQVMVLTGACSGAGVCTAQMAARLGVRVVLLARAKEMLDSLAGMIASSGGQVMPMAADVRIRAEVEAAAQAAVERFGRIDTWINNAGVSIYGRLDQIRESDSRRLFDVNFWGVVNGSLAALPYLMTARGSLINVGSEVGDGPAPLQGMYSSSKYAVKGFTDALRLEVEQGDGAVSVTLIQPPAADMALGIDPLEMAESILAVASGRDQTQRAAVRELMPGPISQYGRHQPQPPSTTW